jgi:MFS family permease
MDRIRTTAGCFFIMLTLGCVYSYASLFAKPVQVVFGTSALVSIIPFIVVTFCLSMNQLLGGALAERVGAKRLVVGGTMLWATGNVLAGVGLLLSLGLPWLIATYGIIGGIGAGLAYVPSATFVVRWFPKNLGLASGLAVAGFGFGASFYGFVLKSLPVYQALSVAVKDPNWSATSASVNVARLAFIFIGTGLAFALLAVPGALLLKEAPEAIVLDDGAPKLAFSELAGTGDIWVLWMLLFISVASGLFVFTNVVPMLTELTGAPIETIAGMYAFIALGNGLGRIFFGWLSDQFGPRAISVAIFATEFIAFMLLDTPLAKTLPLSIFFISAIMLCYGGSFAMIPVLVTRAVGIKNLAPGYGLVLSAWGFASATGSIGAIYARGFPVTTMLTPIDLVICIAIIMPFLATLGVMGKQQLSAPSTI